MACRTVPAEEWAPSVVSAFWSKVDKTGECWIWHGEIDRRGYGRFKRFLAHRISWSLSTSTADFLGLDHLCRVHPCVNPAHLEPVTQRENTLRGISLAAVNARKTHCPAGHPYDEANTYVYRGARHTRRCCRACNRALPVEAGVVSTPRGWTPVTHIHRTEVAS